MVTKPTNDAVVTDPISADLKKVMRQLKLGRMLDTLPERLTLARQQHLSHAAFLELVLADEATRRDTSSAARRARAAGLDPAMRLDTWDETAAVRYDRTLWTDLTSLRFLDGPHGALLLGAVGVGKTHLATALGHIAVRRRDPHPDAARRRDVQAAQGIPTRQQHRSRDAPPGPSPAADHRRLRPAAHGRHRDRRLLRTRRRPPPQGLHRADLQPRAPTNGWPS